MSSNQRQKREGGSGSLINKKRAATEGGLAISPAAINSTCSLCIGGQQSSKSNAATGQSEPRSRIRIAYPETEQQRTRVPSTSAFVLSTGDILYVYDELHAQPSSFRHGTRRICPSPSAIGCSEEDTLPRVLSVRRSQFPMEGNGGPPGANCRSRRSVPAAELCCCSDWPIRRRESLSAPNPRA